MSDIDERQQQHDRAMHDLSMIRDIVRVHEQKPLLEWWAFLAWGVIIIAATLVHLANAAALSVEQALLRIWLPAVVAGALAETAAWFVCMRKRAGEGLSKRFVQLLLGGCGLAVVLAAIVLTLLAEQALTPALLLLLLSLPLLLYAQASFIWLFSEAAVTVLAGVVLLFVEISPGTGYTIVGLSIGIILLVTGVHSLLLERFHSE